jgi:hypothetical protein
MSIISERTESAISMMSAVAYSPANDEFADKRKSSNFHSSDNRNSGPHSPTKISVEITVESPKKITMDVIAEE